MFNLGSKQMIARLQPAASFSDRVRAFLSAHPGYPLLRILLQACEAYWLPAYPIATDSDTGGQTEIDVQMLIKKA